MKRKLVTGLFLLVLPALTRGQNCYDYPCVIQKVKQALALKDYQTAFNNLESAAAYPESDTEEIANLRQALFTSIQREKEQAESERQRAEQAEMQARNNLEIVKRERNRSDALRREAEKNGEINRLTAQALEIQAEDPGLAAKLAHYAFELSGRQHPLAAKIRRNIYQNPSTLFLSTSLVGHRDQIIALNFSPDGQLLLTGSKDGTAILWDLNGKILRHFIGHTDDVTHVSFSPDGQSVLTGSRDHNLKLWDLQGTLIQNFIGHNRPISNAVFSMDGRQILSYNYQELKLWDLSGQEQTGFEAPYDYLESVTFTENDRRIAAVNTSGEVMIWDLQGKLLSRVGMQIDNLVGSAFSPDGSLLLVNSIGRKTQLWNVATNALERELIDNQMFRAAHFSDTDGHLLVARKEGTVQEWELSGRIRGSIRNLGSRYTIRQAAFSPDGRRMLTTGDSGPAQLWDLASRQPFRQGGHSLDITAMVTAPGGEQILTGDADGGLIAWTPDGQKQWTAQCYAGKVQSMAFAANGETFAVGSVAGIIEIRHKNGTLLNTVQGPAYRFGYVWDVAFSPDGRLLLYSAIGGYLQMLDLDSNTQRDFDIGATEVRALNFSSDGKEILLGNEDGIVQRYSLNGALLQQYAGNNDALINDVCFSPDGRNVLAAKGKLVYIWDLAGNLLDSLSGHTYDITDLAFSTDGRYLVTGGYEGEAFCWNAQGELLVSLEFHSGQVSAVDFLPVCSTCPPRLLTAGEDQLGMIWDIEGRPLQRLGTHQAEIRSVAATSDGKLSATGDRNGQIYFWNEAGKVVLNIPAHEESIQAMAFSPDGQNLLTGSSDNTAKLWDRRGQLLYTFAEHEYDVSDVTFSPDGRQLFTAAGGTLYCRDQRGQLLFTYEVPFGIAALDIATDGREIALAGGEGKIVCLDSKGKLLWEIQTEPYPIRDLAYTPDGTMLLVAIDPKNILLLDLDGQVIRVFSGHEYTPHRIVFSPACETCKYENGQVFASGARDGSVILWDIRGQELQRLNMEYTNIADLVFTDNGTKLFIGLEDRTVMVPKSIEPYFTERSAFTHPQSREYNLPFDFHQFRDPGPILAYGLTYLEASYLDQYTDLALLDSSRVVMEYLVAHFGPGYRFFLSEVGYNYAKFHFRRGQLDEAIEAYKKVLASDPSTAWLNVELATVYIYAGNWEKGRAIYDQWLGKKWDPTVSAYARTWDEAFYKYLEQTGKTIEPLDPTLITTARNYLLEAMNK